MARRFTGSEADAEDIAQEAFLRAFRGLDSFKGEAQFSTWLYRISWNLCADWSRRHARLRKKTRPIEDAEDLPDERGQVEKRLLDEEDRVRVRDAVQGLDERYREPVVLLYFQKLSYEQIAAVMDIPLKTVETRLYRARGMLREMLERDSRGGDA
jgi:RNA polymerase sigma-70 factor (ECF subfamily)